MRRTILLAVVILPVAALLAAALVARAPSASATPELYSTASSAPTASQSAASGDVVFSLGITQPYDGFNPFANWSGSTWDVLRLCYDFLDWGDTNYPNPEYDELYRQQLAAVDPANPADTTRRAEIVHKMQQVLYRDSPYIVMWYNVNLQAYRTDRWTGYDLVPPGNGAPFFNLTRTTYQDLQPKVATTTSQGGSGFSTAVWAVLAIVAISVVAIVIWLVKR